MAALPADEETGNGSICSKGEVYSKGRGDGESSKGEGSAASSGVGGRVYYQK